MGVRFERIVTIVLDSVGIGELPDASRYGDEGSDTLGNIARRVPLHLPALRHLGLDRLVPALGHPGGVPAGAWGRMAEASAGKDSVTGHWEMAGIVLEQAFPTFPDGFPPEVMDAFTRGIGRPAIGNVVASGTEVIERFGAEHLRTGAPIVYTSADSVFQIAAHEDVVPVPELYRWCEVAYEIVGEGHGRGPGHRAPVRRRAGRVHAHQPSARLRAGAAGADRARSPHRRRPPGRRDRQDQGPVRRARRDAASRDGIRRRGHGSGGGGDARRAARPDLGQPRGLRRACTGTATTSTATHATSSGSTRGWPTCCRSCAAPISSSSPPTTATTRRRRAPTTRASTCRCWRSGALVAAGVSLGTRETFADLGQTMADNFGVAPLPRGTSFLEALGSSSLARPHA